MRGIPRYQRKYRQNENIRKVFLSAYQDKYPLDHITSIQNNWDLFSKRVRNNYQESKVQQIDLWDDNVHSGQYFKLVMPNHEKKMAIDNGYLYTPQRQVLLPCGFDSSGNPVIKISKYYEDIYQVYLDLKLELAKQLPYNYQCNLNIIDFVI
mgnify:CR=1 FL=1